MSGHTTYRISDSFFDTTTGRIESVESELEFPLNTWLFGLEAGAYTKDPSERDLLRITLTGLVTVGHGSGNMKDSDFISDGIESQPPPAGIGATNPGLDIYSESDASLSDRTLEVKATYNIWTNDRIAFGPLAGYRYEHFQYEISNLRQVGFGPYAAAGFTINQPGRILDYEITYNIPYLGLHSEALLSGKFRTAVDIGFSPFTTARDRDDHLLRTKLSTGDTSGLAYLVALNLQWNIGEKDWLSIRGDYLKIDTDGTQTQFWYGNADAPAAVAGDSITGIQDRITSQQISAFLLFAHRF
jgi:outer membrane protease